MSDAEPDFSNLPAAPKAKAPVERFAAIYIGERNTIISARLLEVPHGSVAKMREMLAKLWPEKCVAARVYITPENFMTVTAP